MTGRLLLLTYTPRRDVDLDAYHHWLREVDNPFFNSRPIVRRYTNFRIAEPIIGSEGFTHFDLLEIEGNGDARSVFDDAEIDAFAKNWVRLWGEMPDPDLPDQSINYRVQLCEVVAQPPS